MKYDGTNAFSKITKTRFGYSVTMHEHWLEWGGFCSLGWYRWTLAGAKRKANRELMKYRKSKRPKKEIRIYDAT